MALVALASFFPEARVTGEVVKGLSSFTPPDVINVITDQIQRILDADGGGLPKLGVLGPWACGAG